MLRGGNIIAYILELILHHQMCGDSDFVVATGYGRNAACGRTTRSIRLPHLFFFFRKVSSAASIGPECVCV